MTDVGFILVRVFQSDQPSMVKLTHAAEDIQHSLHDKAEKMKDAAKKATDLAKQKAGPIYASCQPSQS